MPARRLQVIAKNHFALLTLERGDEGRGTSGAWNAAIDGFVHRSGGNLDRRADDQEAPARGHSRQDQRHVVTTLIHPPLTVGGPGADQPGRPWVLVCPRGMRLVTDASLCAL